MGFHFTVGVMTDVGRVRAINEDSFSIAPHRGLFMVADGLGGQNAGEIASKMAIETIEKHLLDRGNPLIGKYREELSPDTNRILSSIRLANSAIYEAGQRNPEQQGMGTTISSVFINGDVMTVAHVGDSRIYLIREGRLVRLTADHSLVEEQLRRGLITELEAEKSKHRNIITRALGAEETIQVDADEEILLDHDKILLCTDGLTDMVRDEDISRMVLQNGNDPQKACAELADMANAKGGVDNITVILVDCEKDVPITGGLRRVIRSVRGLFARAKEEGLTGPEEEKGEGAT
jgi:serine/threonine protein phosphatase PrpC